MATSGFIMAAALAAVVSLIFVVAGHALMTSAQASEEESVVARVAQEVCTQVYVAGIDPSANASLRTYGGGSVTVQAPSALGTPIPVSVQLAAAQNGAIALTMHASGATQQAVCPVPTPRPAYGSTVVVP